MGLGLKSRTGGCGEGEEPPLVDSSNWNCPYLDRWNGVLLLVRKDCANVKFTTCFDKTHPFTENTLSFPVQIENLTLAKSSCVRVKVLRSSDQIVLRVYS